MDILACRITSAVSCPLISWLIPMERRSNKTSSWVEPQPSSVSSDVLGPALSDRFLLATQYNASYSCSFVAVIGDILSNWGLMSKTKRKWLTGMYKWHLSSSFISLSGGLFCLLFLVQVLSKAQLHEESSRAIADLWKLLNSLKLTLGYADFLLSNSLFEMQFTASVCFHRLVVCQHCRGAGLGPCYLSQLSQWHTGWLGAGCL